MSNCDTHTHTHKHTLYNSEFMPQSTSQHLAHAFFFMFHVYVCCTNCAFPCLCVRVWVCVCVCVCIILLLCVCCCVLLSVLSSYSEQCWHFAVVTSVCFAFLCWCHVLNITCWLFAYKLLCLCIGPSCTVTMIRNSGWKSCRMNFQNCKLFTGNS